MKVSMVFWRLALMALAVMLCSCLKRELQTGLTEAESQEIIVTLGRHGIDATRSMSAAERGKEPAWTVYVKGGEQNLVTAWQVLQENGLPRQHVKGLDDVFANSGIIPTAGEEKARLLVGLAGEISRTLKSVNGVVDARVHVVLPENSPLLDKKDWSPTTASVLLKYRGDNKPLTDDEIKSLVAKGVEGLTPENVGVVWKRVYPMVDAPHDILWYLQSEEVLIASVALLGVTTLLMLAFLIRSRHFRRQVVVLREQLKAAPGQQMVKGAGKV